MINREMWIPTSKRGTRYYVNYYDNQEKPEMKHELTDDLMKLFFEKNPGVQPTALAIKTERISKETQKKTVSVTVYSVYRLTN